MQRVFVASGEMHAQQVRAFLEASGIPSMTHGETLRNIVIDRFEEPGEDGILNLYCSILVDRESQKGIVVGKSGSMIKAIGTAARQELERFFGTRVHLDLHVKLKPEWRDDERILDEMGLPPKR